jgi:hypothetical protein
MSNRAVPGAEFRGTLIFYCAVRKDRPGWSAMDFPDRKMGSDIVWIERRAGKCPDAIGRLANHSGSAPNTGGLVLQGSNF